MTPNDAPANPAKHGRCHEGSSDSPSQHHTPLPQLGQAPALQGRINKDGDNRRARDFWHFLCYLLHAFLVALHLILLVVAISRHPEHQVIIPGDEFETFTTRLTVGLQAFYTLYTALLVFVTQRLMLSVIFSRPKKLTQIHDICGAWAGFGAALSALWQQSKVSSSVMSIVLVTVYFACISVLHVTSSTLMQFQFSNHTVTSVSPLLGTYPDPSVDLLSLDWTAMTPLVPFLEGFYNNETIGLVNNTLYDSPLGFLAGAVHGTTLDAHCGLLTNLSINTSENNTWNVNASMPGVSPISITVSYPPLLNEIWFSPSIQCLEPICSTFILYLVSAELTVDGSVGSASHVYINGSLDGTSQNFSTPIYFVACSLNATNHTVALDASPYPLNYGNQPANGNGNATWSAFSLEGSDLSLTSAISNAMKYANSLPPSPFCQPIMSYPALWANITTFNAYMISLLGMGISPCYGTSLAQYSGPPSLLTRDQMEGTVSQIAAEFIWLAGELGTAGGGFDRRVVEYQTVGTWPLWSLNINLLPVIFALCASIILLLLVLGVLWRSRPEMVSDTGVLAIMWFGSRSRVLRDHLRTVQTPSPIILRASGMFETIFWTRTSCGQEENNGLYTVVPLCDQETRSRDSGSSRQSVSELGNLHSSAISRSRPSHVSNIPHGTRNLCYALHLVLAGLHITLLALLVHHPEQSVVVPFESDTMTIGLSALLQVIYTLYTSVLVLLMQRLALLKIVSERQKLTTVHDVSRAWSGIGAAIHILWKQHIKTSSIWKIMAVVAYLTMMLALHITSSSIMGWELYIPVGAIQMDLAMPDSTVNISQLAWTEIFPIARSVAQNIGLLPISGLQNSTLYDVSHMRGQGGTFPTGLINTTTFSAHCGLVPNVTLSSPNNQGEYSIAFMNGINNGSFLEPPIWKDVAHTIAPTTKCIACPQTLFYMITTGIDVDESVNDPVVIELNWTYTPSGGNPQISTTSTYIAACSLSAQTVLVSASDPFGVPAPSSTRMSWSAWSPDNATNLSLGMATALSTDTSTSFPMFFQSNSSANFTDMDRYIMSLLGLDLSYANTTSVSQSSADPSVTLSPWKLENAIAQTAAMFLWTAGQVGEDWGGFDPPSGESQGTSAVQLWYLHLNKIPVLVASIATFVALILAIIIIGKGPSRDRPMSISGTSVLECLWLEAHSELLHSRLQTVEEPHLDTLRAAGMFDTCPGDIGLLGHPEDKDK